MDKDSFFGVAYSFVSVLKRKNIINRREMDRLVFYNIARYSTDSFKKEA